MNVIPTLHNEMKNDAPLRRLAKVNFLSCHLTGSEKHVHTKLIVADSIQLEKKKLDRNMGDHNSDFTEKQELITKIIRMQDYMETLQTALNYERTLLEREREQIHHPNNVRVM